MLGNDGAVGAGDLGAPDDRAEVLRVEDRVQGDQQRRAAVEKLPERPLAPRLELGRDALVDARRHRVESRRRHGLDRREAGDLDQARVVAEAGG